MNMIVAAPYTTKPSTKSSKRYDALTRYAHWVAAVLIIYTMIVGFSLRFLVDTPYFSFFSILNMSIGTLVVPIMLIRYVWKFFRPAVAYPTELSNANKNMAHLMHELFYLLIFVMLISGFLMLTHDYALFWMIHIPQPIDNPEVNAFFFIVHRMSIIAVLTMLVLHIVAVAKHQWINKRNILGRMI